MVSCKEAAELASRQLDEPLSFRQRAGLRFHMMMCALCRRFATQLAALQRLSRVAGESGPNSIIAAGGDMQETLPAVVKARIKDAISGKG